MKALLFVDMNKRTGHIIFFLLATSCFLLTRGGRVLAQQITDPQSGQKIERAVSSGNSGQEGRVSFKLEPGGHVAVDNRTIGRITIIGWDKDTVEATATSERGVE